MQQSIFRNRTYMLLLIAGIFAIIGYSMFLTTTTWYVVHELSSASVLGLVLITATVPRLILLTFGGVLADKYKKTTIMFSTNLIQAMILFIIYWLVDSNSMTLVFLLVTTAAFGMLDAFFGPASTSMIPKVVEKSQLQRANAYFQGVDQVAFIIGPILAGVIMEMSSIASSYFVATFLVLCSAIFVFPPLIREEPVKKQDGQSPIQDLREGVQYIRSSSFLLTGILVLITLNVFIFGGLQIAIPLLVDAHGGTPINLSYMEVSLGVGMIFGTLTMGGVTLKRKGFTSLMGLFATIFSFLLFSVSPNLTMLTIVVFLIGFSMPFVFVPFFTAAQEKTDIRIMGRVMSIIFLAMNGFDPIAYGILSVLTASGFDIQFLLLISGLLGLAIAGGVWMKGKVYVTS